MSGSPDQAETNAADSENLPVPMRHQILAQLRYIPVASLRDAKLEELHEIIDIGKTKDGVPQIAPEKISRQETDRVRRQGIDPHRYKIWLNSLLPSDRPLARKLVDSLTFLDTDAVRGKMISRLDSALEAAGNKSLIWIAMSRYFSPAREDLFMAREWFPSGYKVQNWYGTYLKAQGFTEVEMHNPVIKDSRERQTGPFITVGRRQLPVYDSNHVNWEERGNPRAVRYFERRGKRVALVAGFQYADAGTVTAFVTENTRSVGALCIAEDWALSGKKHSHLTHQFPPMVTRYARSVSKDTVMVYGYGYTTTEARGAIDEMSGLYEFGLHPQLKPYEADAPLHTLSEVFSPVETDAMISMSPYSYLHQSNFEYFQEYYPTAPLVHSGISVPNALPDVLWRGPWPEIGKYPLLPHPSSK
jgi:hypothetical protein